VYEVRRFAIVGTMGVVFLCLVAAMVAGFLTRPICACVTPEMRNKVRDGAIKKVQGCIDNWGPECADLNFTALDGIEKRYLIQGLPASASAKPPVVCEQDATAEHCTSVHWPNP
jgi:hypothetical protein